MKLVELPKNADYYNDWYKADEESLGVSLKNKIEWFNCREDFQRIHPRVDKVFYLISEQFSKNIISFIDRVESLLKLPVEQKAKFYKTTHERIFFYRLGEFWRRRGRRELFTILLRDGRYYQTRYSFWNYIEKRTEYLREIVEAFKYFLKGNTTIKGKKPFEGWLMEFGSEDRWDYYFNEKKTKHISRRLGK